MNWEFLEQSAFQTPLKILLLLGVTLVATLVCRWVLMPLIEKIIHRTQFKGDDYILEQGIPKMVLYLVPLVVLYFGASFIPVIRDPVERIAFAVLTINFAAILIKSLSGLHYYLGRKEVTRKWSLTGLIQAINFIIIVIAAIVSISAILGKSPAVFLSGLGAVAAILTLAFRETILSIVSGILIQWNDMFREGDWLEIPHMGVDGDLISLGLHTAKIQNWDKTISTVPTSKLVSEPVKNWRGMSDTGGRRIKRSIYLDQTSIRFLDEQLLTRLKHIELISDYIQDKTREIEKYNQMRNLETSVNKRGLTNIGLFRAYIKAYLKNHPKIHQNLTLMVRQLEPHAEKGLPLQIYCFTNDIRWVNFENIQSDIFDHIYAILPEFDLHPFQRISSRVSKTSEANSIA